MTLRYLIVDGYAKQARQELVEGGASMAAELYERMLSGILPPAVCDRLFPSDSDAELPQGAALDQYDAIAWTGCSLSIFEDDPRVHRQVELARAAYEKGIPSFGSCWGLQMAVFAAGGMVAPHPRGREMGIARKIQITPEGRGHPLYVGKPSVFDGFISHVDEVTHMPPGGVHLAHNSFAHIQAAAVTHQRGTFWGVQYHPEYDLHEMARLTFCRIDKLIEGGFFASRDDALTWIDSLEALHRDPTRKDLAWQLGVDADIIDPVIRQVEVRNWIEHLVLSSLRR